MSKYTVANIISNSLIINELYIEIMCFVNWRFRSFVQYTKPLHFMETAFEYIIAASELKYIYVYQTNLTFIKHISCLARVEASKIAVLLSLQPVWKHRLSGVA